MPKKGCGPLLVGSGCLLTIIIGAIAAIVAVVEKI